MVNPCAPRRLSFGEFDLDVAAYELRRVGRSVRLERRPMDLLLLLVERRGELVSRADIIDRLWGDGVFVDVETGSTPPCASCARRCATRPTPRLRADRGRKGYRFAALVEELGPAQPVTPARATLAVPLRGHRRGAGACLPGRRRALRPLEPGSSPIAGFGCL